MQTYLNRIQQVNSKLNAIIQPVEVEKALKKAQSIDAKLAKKEPVGFLYGLPITIKDCCKVKDFIISKGSHGYHFQPTEDAIIVSRLRSSDGIIVGLTNVPEFNLAYETDNDRYGRTRNPYNLERTPGGSSGGEASIIAAGGSVLGIGSDTGGSIRQPAHNTGIVGLKPTRGLLPNTGHIPNDQPTLLSKLTSYGPMARFTGDISYILPLLTGQKKVEKTPAYISYPFKDLRIAFYTENGVVSPDQATLQTIQNVVSALKGKVGEIDLCTPPHLAELYSLITETFFFGGDEGKGLKNLLHQLNIKKPSRSVQEFLAISRRCKFPKTEYPQRLNRIDQIRISLERFFSSYNAIICPAAATPAKLHGRSFIEGRDFSYLSLYNIMGWPALVVRCGSSAEGLPIGIQIVGKAWKESTILAIAQKLEALLGGWQKPPLFP